MPSVLRMSTLLTDSLARTMAFSSLTWNILKK
jgi:hypothetical protein